MEKAAVVLKLNGSACLAFTVIHPQFLAVVVASVAQTVTIDPVGAVTAVEGNTLTITCTFTDGVTSGRFILLRQNGVLLTGDDLPPTTVTDAMRFFPLPVDRMKNGNTYDCISGLGPEETPDITLTVTCEWTRWDTLQLCCVSLHYTTPCY